jgi:uncharacterized membrane protein YczE
MMPRVKLAATSTSPVSRRLLTLVIGLVLVALGVAMTIRGEIGVAPYDVVITGLAERSGLDIGLAAMALPLVFVALGVALGGRAGPGTVLAILLVGPTLHVILDALPEVTALVPRIALFGVGMFVVAAGVTAVIIAEIGSGPAEVLMLAVHERGHELARARTGIELTSVAVGWALGGQVGVGTAIVALAIGPLLRTFLQWSGYRADEADAAAVCAEPGA